MMAEKIRKSVNASKVLISGKTVSYTVSIDVSVRNRENSVNLDDLISQADKALYSAKNTGKNKFTLYSQIAWFILIPVFS